MGTACRSYAFVFVFLPIPAHANIGVEFRPAHAEVMVGGTVGIGVYVVSDAAEDQLLSGAQIIIGWESSFLRLAGNDNAGAADLLYSGFPRPDPYGLNEASPPQDGLGMYVAFANLGMPVPATASGTLLTTMLFEALRETPGTQVEVIVAAGTPEGRTTVFDGNAPNRDVTGDLRGASVTVVPAPPVAAGLVLAAAPATRRRRHG